MSQYSYLAFPRSGSHWFAHSFQHIFKRKYNEGLQHFQYKSEDTFLFGTHHYNEIAADAPLIMMLRNYRECISRQNEINPGDARYSNESYVNMLRSFDNHQGRKMLLYYEDLLSNPQETLEPVLEFVTNETPDGWDHFLENFEAIRVASLSRVNHATAGTLRMRFSDTNGADWCRKFDDRIHDLDPELYDKYIKRYKFEE